LGLFFNGGPTLFAHKSVLLLIGHLFQHEFGFMALAAFEFANLIVAHFHVMLGNTYINIRVLSLFIGYNINN
jgi:hypothetical protein